MKWSMFRTISIYTHKAVNNHMPLQTKREHVLKLGLFSEEIAQEIKESFDNTSFLPTNTELN